MQQKSDRTLTSFTYMQCLQRFQGISLTMWLPHDHASNEPSADQVHDHDSQPARWCADRSGCNWCNNV